jgi:hypothetical protein
MTPASDWRKNDPLTELHAGLARIEERMTNVITKLEAHIVDEHREFRDALAEMRELRAAIQRLEQQVDRIHTSARVTRWLITGFGALIAWGLAVKSGIAQWMR